MASFMTNRYIVIGNPIEHSKSPYIHQRFAEQTGRIITYSPLLSPIGGFAETLDNFRASGGQGANVTVPFKEDAWRRCEQRTKRAQLAGAVNTIWFENEKVCGDNTDGVGLVRDLRQNLQVEIADAALLIVGAGGAARGVLRALLGESPQQITLVNRTVYRAKTLISEIDDERLSACGFGALGNEAFDIIINASSAGLRGLAPPLPFPALLVGGTCYDMMYADTLTPFLRWGQAAGADRCFDGLGMLVEQAAESFFLWHGVYPATGQVINELHYKPSQGVVI